MHPGTLPVTSDQDRKLVTAFRSPTTASVFLGLHSRVKVPGLLLRVVACDFRCPFGLSAPLPQPVRPGSGRFPASDPLQLPTLAPATAFLRPPLPVGTLTSLRIKAFCRFGCRLARLPNPPDSLSLPGVAPIASFGTGSSFLVRYVSGGLLFLKPLGTSFTMIPKAFTVNGFMDCYEHISTTYIMRVSNWLHGVNGASLVDKTRGKTSVVV